MSLRLDLEPHCMSSIRHTHFAVHIMLWYMRFAAISGLGTLPKAGNPLYCSVKTITTGTSIVSSSVLHHIVLHVWMYTSALLSYVPIALYFSHNVCMWYYVSHQMVGQMEAWADELGGNYELTMFGKRTVVATEVADVRRVLNLRPSLFKRGLSAVRLYQFRFLVFSAYRRFVHFPFPPTPCARPTVRH